MILKVFVAIPDGKDFKYLKVHEARTVILNPEHRYVRPLMKATSVTGCDLALMFFDLTFLFDYEFSTVVACDDNGNPYFAVDYSRVRLDDEWYWTLEEIDANLWKELNK